MGPYTTKGSGGNAATGPRAEVGGWGAATDPTKTDGGEHGDGAAQRKRRERATTWPHTLKIWELSATWSEGCGVEKGPRTGGGGQRVATGLRTS